jgi:membrane protein
MLKRAWTILREAVSAWLDDNATRLAAALAFYTLLSVAPLLVIATAIAGLAFGQDAASGKLVEEMRGFMGDAGADVVKTTIEHADRPKTGVFATIVGIVTLLVGASGVFGELQAAMNAVWNVKPKPGQGIWGTIRTRFLSFGMVLVVGFLLLVSLVITTALSAFGDYISGMVPGLPTLMHVANFVFSFLVVAILFALIFKFLPDAKIAWRDVWFGALVTAALFTLGKYLIGLYLGKAAPGSAFGAAGSVVAFLIWVYYSGLIVFFGAELTEVTAKHAGRKIVPTENAEPAQPAAKETRSRKTVHPASGPRH